jgi:hypothetical protein
MPTQQELNDVRDNLKNVVEYLNSVIELIGGGPVMPQVRSQTSSAPQQGRAPSGLPTSGAYIVAESSFAQKDQVKAMGFRWAKDNKTWYYPVKTEDDAAEVTRALEKVGIKWKLFGDLEESGYSQHSDIPDDVPF